LSPRAHLLVWLPFFAGCLQDLTPGVVGVADTVQSDGGSPSTVTYAEGGVCPAGMVAGGSDGVGGHGVCIPADKTTPPITIVSDTDPTTTKNACVATEKASLSVRTKYCAGCHANGAVLGGLGAMLDDNALIAARSTQGALDDAGRPQRLVVPGDPDDSRLYQRMYEGLALSAAGMPPADQSLRPNASDCSLLRQWILCLADAGASSLNDRGPPPATDPGAAASADGGSTAPGGGRTGDAGTGIGSPGDAGGGSEGGSGTGRGGRVGTGAPVDAGSG
jgi:hypothetical protein